MPEVLERDIRGSGPQFAPYQASRGAVSPVTSATSMSVVMAHDAEARLRNELAECQEELNQYREHWCVQHPDSVLRRGGTIVQNEAAAAAYGDAIVR